MPFVHQRKTHLYAIRALNLSPVVPNANQLTIAFAASPLRACMCALIFWSQIANGCHLRPLNMQVAMLRELRTDTLQGVEISSVDGFQVSGQQPAGFNKQCTTQSTFALAEVVAAAR